MKILVYGINYAPEVTGIGKYTGEMCEWLSLQGHKVEVITAMPYYPQWEVNPSYKGRGWHIEIINGVKVKRSPFYVPKKVTGISRIIHEFSFFLSSLIFWLKAFFTRYDSVVCVYPPLCIGLFPVIYKWLYKCTLIFHIQDLQVDAARELNLIKNNRILNLFEKVEKFYFKHSTIVSTISHGMMKRLEEKGVSPEKILLFPNWVDTDTLQPMVDQKESLKEKYNFPAWEDVVLYAGNIGEKQGLDTIMEVAEAYQAAGNSNTKFLIVGEGNAKKRLIKLAEEKHLENVRFASLVPKEELAGLLNMADLHLVLQKKGVKDLVMPSKLTSILSCGGVALIAAEKESNLRQLVENYQFGISAEAEDAQSIQNAISDFLSVKDESYSRQARKYALNYLNKDSILSNFEKALIQTSLPDFFLEKA